MTSLLQAVLAVTLAVACSATLVAWRHIEYGQWAIWSSASVVTGNAASAHLKLRDRGLGALLGVPLGLAVGAALPHVLLVHLGDSCLGPHPRRIPSLRDRFCRALRVHRLRLLGDSAVAPGRLAAGRRSTGGWGDRRRLGVAGAVPRTQLKAVRPHARAPNARRLSLAGKDNLFHGFNKYLVISERRLPNRWV